MFQKKTNMKTKAFLFLCLGLLAGCASSTHITGSWKNPNPGKKTYHSLFIAALTSNTVAKATLENDMEAVLKKQGISSVKSIDEFPPGLFKDSLSKFAMIEKMQSKGSDAVLTISILKKKTESRYVGGGYAPMSRFGYYGSFGGYYSYWSPYAYNPGYYTQDDVYFLETNLYDSATELLLWSAQSETYTYEGLGDFSREFAKTIVGQMKMDGLLSSLK